MNWGHLSYALAFAGALSSVGCACDSLWDSDAPRPSLDVDDPFAVDPPCPRVSFNASAVAPVQTLVVITGHRNATGLGAEGVPVDVEAGPCGTGESARAPGAVDAGARDAGARKNAASPLDPANAASESCTAGQGRVDSANATITLSSTDSTCVQLSTSRLSCTLDPNGVAHFAIVGAALPEVDPEGYFPVCVRPFVNDDSDAASRSMEREIRAIPSSLPSLALGVVSLDTTPVDPPVKGTDCSNIHTPNDCTVRRPLRLVAGVVSADLPTDEVSPTTFEQVRQAVNVTVGSETLPGPKGAEAFLSESASCTKADGGALPVSIPAGATESSPFFLCATGSGGNFRIDASSVADPGLSGTSPTISIAPLIERISASPTTGNSAPLLVLTCGENAAVPATSDLLAQGATSAIRPDDCSQTPTPNPTGFGSSAPPVQDGGPRDASADGNPPVTPISPPTPTSSDAAVCEGPIQLADGTTCTLGGVFE